MFNVIEMDGTLFGVEESEFVWFQQAQAGDFRLLQQQLTENEVVQFIRDYE